MSTLVYSRTRQCEYRIHDKLGITSLGGESIYTPFMPSLVQTLFREKIDKLKKNVVGHQYVRASKAYGEKIISLTPKGETQAKRDKRIELFVKFKD